VKSASRQFLVLGLLLAAVVVLFLAAESGQRTLAAASQRVEQAAERERALSAVREIVSQAESGQRGYILLGEQSYLVNYQMGLERLPLALAHLDAAFAAAGPGVRADVAQIARLSHAKFAEMAETLVLFRERGRSAAVELIRTGIGLRTMEQILERIAAVEAVETDDVFRASRSWRASRWSNLAIRVAAGVASVFLVLLLARLVRAYIRSKEREAEESAEREAVLERVVRRRTEDLSELSTQLQQVAEREREALSHELHDELGGLLVAARMDVSWLEERLSPADAEVQAHFARVHETLQEGVELKRRVVESLRPTLLDNLGLFAALRWQLADLCGRAGLACTEHYPEQVLELTPEASIAIFRIVQESLTNVLKHARARQVELHMSIREEWLWISVRDDGIGLPIDRRRALRSHGLASMRHRVAGLGGHWRIIRRPQGGTEVEVRLPLATIAPAAAADRPSTGDARAREIAQ